MADTKISGLSAVTDVQATDEFVLARAGTTKKIDASDLAAGLAGGSGAELDYAQITANVAISATAAASPTNVVVGNSVSYDGSTEVIIEFYAAGVEWAGHGSGNHVLLNLYDGTTSLGVIAQFSNDTAAGAACVNARIKLTPTAGSHTYKVGGWRTNANGNVLCAAGTYVPAFLRITEA